MDGRGRSLVSHAPVELESVSIRRLDADQEKIAGKEFLGGSKEPLVINVTTVKPLGNTQRSSGPVIVLNGQNLLNTRPTGQHTLLAFLPDRKALKATNTVAVVWLGDEQTRTKHPLTLTLAEISR